MRQFPTFKNGDIVIVVEGKPSIPNGTPCVVTNCRHDAYHDAIFVNVMGRGEDYFSWRFRLASEIDDVP